MRELTDLVVKKLSEYGFEIYKQYEEKEHDIIFTNDMVLYTFPENTIGISFQATTKADEVANDVIILNEIPEVMDIEIMEPFIYNTNNQVVQGEEAYKLIEQSIKQSAINEFVRQQVYTNLLEETECHSC